MISFNIRIFSDALTSPEHTNVVLPGSDKVFTVLELLRQLLILSELPCNPLLDGDVSLEVFNDFLY